MNLYTPIIAAGAGFGENNRSKRKTLQNGGKDENEFQKKNDVILPLHDAYCGYGIWCNRL